VIPFASQRAGGQDLATHLRNEKDNEFVEVFEIRGAIARDLNGAVAEWEAQAAALTKCRQYLCSLSVNPDELQGRLTREQYIDYIDRAEAKLGLTGQPRAIVFHIKQDEYGRMREHCHAVWSRIDAEKGKAVPLSFFKEKLMTVTREFARDHGLELPDGYRRHEEKVRRRNRQLSGYDCIKQKETGISHEERLAAVTAAWKRSDDGKSFVRALEDLGYILARGRNERRPVLVDFYGHTTALTRLIDDPDVKTKHVRDRLGPDYAPETLPSVEEAQALAGERRRAIEEFEKAREQGEQVEHLLRHQQARRQKLEAEFTFLKERQREEREQLAAEHTSARQDLKAQYLAESRRVRIDRARRAPKGLAAFLGRVSGIALITKKVQRYRDRQRFEAYLTRKEALSQHQHEEKQDLSRRHFLQAADMDRQLRGLAQVEKRELKSVEQARRKERRQRINARHEHMPSLKFELKPPGRAPKIEKAKKRYISEVARELAEAAEARRARKLSLTEEFARAAREESGDGENGGGTGGALQPAARPKTEADQQQQQQHRKIDLTPTFNKAADPDPPAGGDGGGPSQKPRDPEPDRDPPRPRRSRKRDIDRDR
jgi:hypothetical protein